MWDRLVLAPAPPPPAERPMAAVLAPLYEDAAGEVRLVLTKRPDSMPTHGGQLALPGGRPEPGDGGPVGTALREAKEEVGITPETVEVLGFLEAVHTVSYSRLVVPVVGRVFPEPVLVPDPREVEAVLTPRLADLADEAGWREERWNGRRVWFYDLEGEVLWGATAWMVRRMLGMPT